MILAHAQPKTGHPNCRRPDKVIDAGQTFTVSIKFVKNNYLRCLFRISILYICVINHI